MKACPPGAALLAALLTACSGPGDRIAAVCVESGEMSEAVCACLGEHAEAELAPEQQETLAAMMESAGDEARPEPTVEQVDLAFFLASAAIECQTPS